MNHRYLTLLVGLGLASTATADDCAHRAERNLDVAAGALATLDLRTGAGDLDVRGSAGLDRIEVRGIACASDADLLSSIQLSHRTEGDRALVATEIPQIEDTSWFGSTYARLDLEIRVPARMLLEARDSSGDFDLRGIAGASITDSSGDLEIEEIAGDLRLTDTSGDIEVRALGGSLHIASDSSGDLEADGVGGNVAIDSDSSGDIVLQQVRGDAHVRQDSSGEIRFADVDGSAMVGKDSSGSIEASRIGRDFTVQSDSSGGIEHRDVTGEVRLPAR